MAKPQDEETCCGQGVQRYTPKRWDFYSDKKSCLQVTPHDVSILP
jgi:hypothetical protein